MMIYTGYLTGSMTKLDSVTAIFTFSGSRTPIVYRVTEEEPP
jgi:hypothetical protein